MIEVIFAIVVGLIIAFLIRDRAVCKFKIAYYECKLEHRKVDISHIKNISLAEIIRLD